MRWSTGRYLNKVYVARGCESIVFIGVQLNYGVKTPVNLSAENDGFN